MCQVCVIHIEEASCDQGANDKHINRKGTLIKKEKAEKCMEMFSHRKDVQTTLGVLSRSAEWTLDPLQFATRLNQPLFSPGLKYREWCLRAAQASSDTFLKHFAKILFKRHQPNSQTRETKEISQNMPTKGLVYQMCRQTWQKSIYISTCLYDRGTHATEHVWASRDRFVESVSPAVFAGVPG